MKQMGVRLVFLIAGVGLASAALLPDCSGTDAPRSVGSSAGAGGAHVSAGATGGTMANGGGGGIFTGASCIGAAPSCRGQDISKCCQNDPYGSASCNKGAWVCTIGSVQASAPGCNGQSCSQVDQSTVDAGAGGQASDAGSGGSNQEH